MALADPSRRLSGSSSGPELNLKLHARQALCLTSSATEILYGGAAGGGKSHLARVAAILYCSLIPGLQVYFFRRIRPDLIKNHIEGPKGFRAMLAPLVDAGLAKIVEDEIRFWNGAKIYLCHCKDAKDRFKYQGAEIHFLILEEGTQFEEAVYRFLRSRVRAVGLNLPPHLRNLFPRILITSNPGNIGHAWLKEGFVDAGPMGIRQMPDDEGGMLRQFIPAKLEDNPSMAEDDPHYELRLSGMGSPQLVKAFRDGDWSVIAGAFFPEFDPKLHVIRPFAIPAHWLRFRSFDWGSAEPFSHGWWAVADGGTYENVPHLPRGALIRYREWYGKERANKGLKLPSSAVAAGILQRQAPGERFAYGVADRKYFATDNGPSVAEDFAAQGLLYQLGGDARVPGWQQVRNRLVGANGVPMLYFFDTCLDAIRLLPMQQHDDKDPEDTLDGVEDHAVDEIRYACMSRPYVAPMPEEQKVLRGPETVGELLRAELGEEYDDEE